MKRHVWIEVKLLIKSKLIMCFPGIATKQQELIVSAFQSKLLTTLVISEKNVKNQLN